MKQFPYGTTIGGYSVLHAGNHNSYNDPHTQYDLPIINILQSDTPTTCKILETPYISYMTTSGTSEKQYASLKFVAEIYAQDTSFANERRGSIDIEVYKVCDSDNFVCDMKFTPKSSTTFDGGFTVCVEKINVGLSNEAYKFKLYYTQHSYYKISIVPSVLDFRQHSWSAFINYKVLWTGCTFFTSNTPETIVDTVIGTSYQYPTLPYSLSYTTGSTINLDNVCTVLLSETSAMSITGFTGGTNGQIVTFIGYNNTYTTFVNNSSSLCLKGSIDVTLPTYSKMMFVKVATMWMEFYRNF